MAEMSAASINDLPDSAFAYIEPGGKKDSDGKTVPRSKRHFPVHDPAHTRNALARAPQSPFGKLAMPKIKAAAKKFGIGNYGDKKMDDTPLAIRADLPVRETRNTPLSGFELREQPDGSGGSRLTFTGYACVTESPYPVRDALGEYQETVSRTAFDKTLADGADVSFLVNHEGVSMARTRSGSLRLASDSRGLHVEARLNPARPDVQIARAAIDDGELNEMSFAFKAIRQKWDDDYTDRRLDEVSLHRGDVSIVNYGMNPATAGSVNLRSQAAHIRGFDTGRLVAFARELRAGNLTDAGQATFRSMLFLASADDGEIDGILSEFLDTPAAVEEEVRVETRKGLDLDVARARLHALRLRSA